MEKSRKERKAKLNKQERVLYSQKTQYWPDEFLPFLVAAACVEVVLKNSEKASLIYDAAKKAWKTKSLNKKFRRESINMTVWSINGKQTDGEVGGGTAELPPTSYLTNRTSEKP